MTLAEFFETKYRTIRLLGRSPKTIVLYRRSISWLSETLGRPAELEDLNDDVLAAHLQRILSLNLSRATAKKERSQLVAIANFACRRGHLQRWVDLPAIRTPERVPEAWTIEELRRILESCRRQPGAVGNVPASLWWTSLHLVLWDTGERIGALLKTRFSDLDANCLVVRAECRKNQTRDKMFSLSQHSLDWLQMARKPARELIWPWHQSNAAIYYHYEKLLVGAGLPASRACKFHRVRRSVATHLKAAGVDPQQQLDHASPQTTQKYLDPRLIKQFKAHDVLDLLF